jgi:type I restriction enzyme S subunit
MNRQLSEKRTSNGIKIKYLFNQNRKQIYPNSLEGTDVCHYSIPNVQAFGKGVIENGAEIESNKFLIEQEQLLVSKLNPRKQTVCLCHPEETVTVCSTEFISLYPKMENIDLNYSRYVFLMPETTELLDSMVESVTKSHQRIQPERFENLYFPLPPLNEQKLISRYLDQKITQIDSLVEKIQKKIDLLKEQRTSLINHYVTKGLDPNVEMKDSGIEWIGEIPKHWNLQKLTRFCDRVRNGYVGPTRGIMFETGIIYLQGIHTNKIGTITFTPDGPYYVSPDWSEEHSGTILRYDDIVVVQTGSIGNLGYVTEEFDGANCHAMIIVSTNKTICNGRFLMYSFLSSYVQNFLQSIKTGEILYHINTKKLRLLNVLLPPLHQQTDIVDHLDRETQLIDQLIEKEERRIFLLKEYRQSLISSVVTGKVRVTEDMI